MTAQKDETPPDMDASSGLPSGFELALPPSPEQGPDAEWMARFAAAIERTEDWPSLTLLTQCFVSACGYDRFLYVVDIPKDNGVDGSFTFSTYPREWLAAYLDRGLAEFDPVLAAGMIRMLPFDWAEIPTTHPKSAEVRSQAASHGLRTGCVAPSRGPSLTSAVLMMARNQDLVLAGARRYAILSAAMMASHLILQRSLTLAEMQRTRYASQAGKLSPQDVELLHRFRQGSTVEMLKTEGMDPKGLESRLTRILKRLGGKDLDEALMRASVLGLMQWGGSIA